MIKTEIGTVKFMLRTTLASSRVLRACVLGLVTITAAVIYTSDSADARRYRHRHYARHAHHQQARESYSPAFSSIIVDGNSGATLSASNPDASRHPASLTKIMTLYLLLLKLRLALSSCGLHFGSSFAAVPTCPIGPWQKGPV